ncbi:MAG TPA: IS1595 family transposase [Bacteroidales bacterium]|nr:IS1595 family transposase [Bacteroidales bacterium]
MAIISYLHELFNEQKCNDYIHQLRWQDRQFQCPRCQSNNVKPWGNYHCFPGLKRYKCKGCNRTFNDKTNTVLDGCKISSKIVILSSFLLFLSSSSRRISKETGSHISTAYHWCWYLRNAAISYEINRQLEGIVEADEIYQTAGSKGRCLTGKKQLNHQPRKRGKKQPPGRGHYEKDSPAIIAYVSRDAYTVIIVAKDFTIETVQKSTDIAVKSGSVIYTDSAKSYKALSGYIHDYVNHSQKEYVRGEVHENRSENCFSFLRPYLDVFRGIGKANLPGYTGFFQFMRNHCKLNAFEQSEMTIHAILNPDISNKVKKGDFVKQLDHFKLLQTMIN